MGDEHDDDIGPEVNESTEIEARVPFVWAVSLLSASAYLFIMYGLPGSAWRRFLVWLACGLLVYIFYGFRHSRLHKRQPT